MHLHFSFFIGSLFMAFYWAFMGTKCQVYLRSFILINLPTTHCQTTLNTMVINFVLVIAPSSAPPPPNYVLTTHLVTSSIPAYQPLPLWIVSFVAITHPYPPLLISLLFMLYFFMDPLPHLIIFINIISPNLIIFHHPQQVLCLGTIHPNPILVTIPSP